MNPGKVMIPRIPETRISRDILYQIPEPAFTDTWHPISHQKCNDTITRVLIQNGVIIMDEFFSASYDGRMAYGALILKGDFNTLTKSLIWRNSLNKMASFGICAGTYTAACSNLMMFGDFVDFRKHTKFMNEGEIERIVSSGIQWILPALDEALAWHLDLMDIQLTDEECKALIYDAMLDGIISRQKMVDIHNLLFSSTPAYNCNTLYGFHGACTQLMNSQKLTGSFPIKNWKLNDLINGFLS